VALLIAVLILALGGVSIDLWRVIATHGRVSGAVDAAAIAGAGALDIEALYGDEAEVPLLDPARATSRACAYLAANLERLLECPGPHVEISIEAAEITVTARVRVKATLLRLLSAASGDPLEIEVGATATAAAFRRAPEPVPR
jgi:Flp pilus assembly protein TadG